MLNFLHWRALRDGGCLVLLPPLANAHGEANGPAVIQGCKGSL